MICDMTSCTAVSYTHLDVYKRQDLLLVDLLDAQIGQRRGQADGFAEVEDFGKLIHAGVLQDQLHQRAESDLFAVIHGVGFGNGGEAVVDGVSAGQARAFKANAGEEGVSLDDVFHSLCADVVFHGDFGFQAIGDQRFIAELDVYKRQRWFPFPEARKINGLL